MRETDDVFETADSIAPAPAGKWNLTVCAYDRDLRDSVAIFSRLSVLRTRRQG